MWRRRKVPINLPFGLWWTEADVRFSSRNRCVRIFRGTCSTLCHKRLDGERDLLQYVSGRTAVVVEAQGRDLWKAYNSRTTVIAGKTDPFISRIYYQGCHTPFFGGEGQAVFISLVDVAKEVVWWTSLKGIKTDTFLFGLTFIRLYKSHLKRKVRVERVVWPTSKFIER